MAVHAEVKPCHLVMVTAGANNNKYYDIIHEGDMWVAKYGRIGSNAQSRTYPNFIIMK